MHKVICYTTTGMASTPFTDVDKDRELDEARKFFTACMESENHIKLQLEDNVGRLIEERVRS